MSKIKIAAIAAMSNNHVIGVNNQIPWHIPEDFKYFKRTTLGKPIIMGRKTYESLGKPLPGRANIIVSRQAAPIEGTIGCTSIEEAIKTATEIATRDGVDEIFIIGGSEIYRQTLPKIERLYLTVIDRDYEGDAKFPHFDWKDWHIISQDTREGNPAYTFYCMHRRPI